MCESCLDNTAGLAGLVLASMLHISDDAGHLALLRDLDIGEHCFDVLRARVAERMRTEPSCEECARHCTVLPLTRPMTGVRELDMSDLADCTSATVLREAGHDILLCPTEGVWAELDPDEKVDLIRKLHLLKGRVRPRGACWKMDLTTRNEVEWWAATGNMRRLKMCAPTLTPRVAAIAAVHGQVDVLKFMLTLKPTPVTPWTIIAATEYNQPDVLRWALRSRLKLPLAALAIARHHHHEKCHAILKRMARRAGPRKTAA